jgi:hypothetical protein
VPFSFQLMYGIFFIDTTRVSLKLRQSQEAAAKSRLPLDARLRCSARDIVYRPPSGGTHTAFETERSPRTGNRMPRWTGRDCGQRPPVLRRGPPVAPSIQFGRTIGAHCTWRKHGYPASLTAPLARALVHRPVPPPVQDPALTSATPTQTGTVGASGTSAAQTPSS